MSVQKIQRDNITGLEGLAGLSSSGKMKDVEAKDQDENSFGTVMETQVAPRPRIKEENKRSSREQDEESETSVEEAPEQEPVLTARKSREEETEDAWKEDSQEMVESTGVQAGDAGVHEAELTLEEILTLALMIPVARDSEAAGKPAEARDMKDQREILPASLRPELTDPSGTEVVLDPEAPEKSQEEPERLSGMRSKALSEDLSEVLPEETEDSRPGDTGSLLKVSMGAAVEKEMVSFSSLESLDLSLQAPSLERRESHGLSETLSVEARPQGAVRVVRDDMYTAAASVRAPVLAGLEEQQALQKQVVEALRASVTAHDKQMRVRLDPPEWGHLQMRLSFEKSEVHVQFFAEKAFVGQEIQRSLSDLRESLAHQGCHLGQVSVNVGDRQDWREAFQKDPDEVPGITGIAVKKQASAAAPRAGWMDPRSSVVDRRI